MSRSAGKGLDSGRACCAAEDSRDRASWCQTCIDAAQVPEGAAPLLVGHRRRAGVSVEHIADLIGEVGRARGLFPSPAGLLAALTEEVGELAKAILDESPERVRAEAIQVAAVALRIAAEGDPSLDPLRSAKGLEPIGGDA